MASAENMDPGDVLSVALRKLPNSSVLRSGLIPARTISHAVLPISNSDVKEFGPGSHWTGKPADKDIGVAVEGEATEGGTRC